MPSKQLRDPELRKARALMMVQRRLMGASMADVAAEFNVTEKVVKQAMGIAKRANLLANFEDQILERLVPASLDTIEKAIQSNDTALALEVLKSTGLLLKPQEKAPKGLEAAADDSLEQHIKRIRGESENRAFLPPAIEAGVVDGSISETPPGDPATTAPEICPAGAEDHPEDSLPKVGIPTDPA